MQNAPQRRSLAYILFCLCIAGFGLFVAFLGSEMSIGSVRRIGPGFFPTGLGIIICVLGLLTAFERETANFPRGSLRALIFIALALLVFALAVERLGLIIAVAGLVLLTALAHGRPDLKSIAGVTLVLSALGVLLFIYLLRIPLSPLP